MNGMPRRPTIDDTKMQMAAALCAEDRQRRARAEERAHEVHVHHPPHDRRAASLRACRRSRSRRCRSSRRGRPNVARRRATRRCTSSSLVTSIGDRLGASAGAAIVRRRPRADPRAARRGRPPHPRRASASAQASPMPDDAPVIDRDTAAQKASWGHDTVSREPIDQRRSLIVDSIMDPCHRRCCAISVAIDSVNPLCSVPGASAGEARRSAPRSPRTASAWPRRRRAGGGAGTSERHRRARRTRAPGRSLMFCGHMDTVGVEGMSAPFDPRERNGRLYGRGAQDMKGGVAAMIDAARVVAADGLRDRPAHHRCGRGRGVREHRRRRAGARLAGRRCRRDRADRSCRSASPTKDSRGWRSRRAGAPRTAAGLREGRDAILRMGRVLAQARSARSRTPVAPAASAAGYRVAARVDHRRRTRVEQLSGSRAGCRWSGGRFPARRVDAIEARG